MTSAYCTTCGAELGEARFCTTCGTAVADEAVETLVGPEPASDLSDTAERLGVLPSFGMLPPPVAGLPPLQRIQPLMPMPQPAPKKSPLPWIAVGAVLALVAGGLTAWLVVSQTKKTEAGGAPSMSSTVATQPSASSTYSGSSPATASGTPITDTVGTEDVLTSGNRLRDLVKQDTVRHDAYDKALGNLHEYCDGKQGSAEVKSWIATVTTFPAARESFATQAEAIAADARVGTAIDLAKRLATVQRHLAGAASYGVQWAHDIQVNGRCPAYDSAAAHASQEVSNERTQWIGDFQTFAHDAGVDVTGMDDLFKADSNGLKNGL